jgi:hypothetical protein
LFLFLFPLLKTTNPISIHYSNYKEKPFLLFLSLQATGRKYIASPIRKPPTCFATLLIKSVSVAALDLQCNDPDDLPRQGGPDWAGQCSVSALNFDAGLTVIPKSKSAQWCSSGGDNAPEDNYTWKFIKM